ncbi:helix-turn-helix domain-containing protein [Avibacterium sp. 20-15]|uniref:helix-turn-helix domain-containing protein n=1 Tax=unclassified Avibacterium TaxID=2685287 RepID=UPI0020266398|nr:MULTISPECIES: helix-turn-helix domain-containing protein [unclassified Avibacterium]MCW9733159.1 helix-turn-helix domain-containing protein [Avibacterium sp. 20-15]URL05278.1 helix-turn-helix domain-containing protein [Avibacterium sp. 20-132]
MQQITDTSKHTQQIAIIQRLKQGSCSTLEFRAMGICSPAPRIMELRAKGYDISTSTQDELDHAGVKHKGIGVYTLHSTPQD